MTLSFASPSQALDLKVFLLGGQSNMDGRADDAGLPLALQSPQTDVLFYEGSNLRDLQPGSGADFGPEITFGRTLADAYPDDNFALIKYGVGGTSLDVNWDPVTGGTYSTFRNQVTNGLAALTNAGHTYEIVGMLWTQGERDAKTNRTTAQYEFDLNEFIADVRVRYGTDLPFYLSRLSSGQTNINPTQLTNIRTAQDNVAASDPHAYLIDTDAMGVKGDNLHFNAAGQIALGEAFAQAYIDVVGGGGGDPDPDPDPDPTLGVSFDLNHTSSVAPAEWDAIGVAQSGNGSQIVYNDADSGMTVTLGVGNGQSDMIGRTRTLDKADPAVTLDDMFEDFVIRVGDIAVSGLTPGGAYDVSFIMYDDDEPSETVVQSINNTTDGANTLLGQVSWNSATTLADDAAQRLVALGLIADASGVLTFDITAVGNGGNALINGLIVEPVVLPGDTDFDGDIDDADLGTAFSNYTGPVGAGGGKTAAQGDTDGDGDIDDADLGTAFSGYTGPLAASVPEPGSALLLGVGTGLIARRRRGGAAALRVQ